MPDSKFFGIPFGASGDKATIPEATQPNGAISWQQGFGPDYERDPATDPLAKRVPRDETNEFYFQTSNALRFLQLYGAPEWYSVDGAGNPVSYPLSARVRHPVGGVMHTWQSISANNTAQPGTDPTKWISEEAGWNFGVASGTNALAVAVVPALLALTAGARVTFQAAANSTGAVTLNVNGLGAQPVFSMPDVSQLGAGDILTGRRYDVIWGGDGWYMFNPAFSTNTRRGVISRDEIRGLFGSTALTASTRVVSTGSGSFANAASVNTPFGAISDDGQADWVRAGDNLSVICQRTGRYILMANMNANILTGGNVRALSTIFRIGAVELFAGSVRLATDNLVTVYGGGVEVRDVTAGEVVRPIVFQDNAAGTSRTADYTLKFSSYRLTAL